MAQEATKLDKYPLRFVNHALLEFIVTITVIQTAGLVLWVTIARSVPQPFLIFLVLLGHFLI
jgi:hypothetical protein